MITTASLARKHKMNKRSLEKEDIEKPSKRIRLDKEQTDLVFSSHDDTTRSAESFLPLELWYKISRFIDDDRVFTQLASSSRWMQVCLDVPQWTKEFQREQKILATVRLLHKLEIYGLNWLPQVLQKFNGTILGSLAHYAYIDEEQEVFDVNTHYVDCDEDERNEVRFYYNLDDEKPLYKLPSLRPIFIKSKLNHHTLEKTMSIISTDLSEQILFDGKTLLFLGDYQDKIKHTGHDAVHILKR